MDMPTLELEIKTLIIKTLNLEDIEPESIKSEAALFGEGLELDSIDALELGVALNKKYNGVFRDQNEDTKKHFESVRTLALYIQGKKS